MTVGGAASLLCSAGCGVSLPKSEPIEVSVDEAQVKEILREVFPNLSDEELSDCAATLELKAALALEVELSDIRDVADGLSKGSPS